VARKLRIEYPGAVYHVISRGNRQESIYRDDRDREVFLKTLGEACKKTGWRVHSFVLMGNHFHLLLETPEANLSDGMKWLQGTYTQRFNSRHRVWGHLFQGRYKALNVADDGQYFQAVSTYIHLNPIRAKLVKCEAGALKKFRWSSYPEYLKLPRKRPAWLETRRVLGGLGIGQDNVLARRGIESWTDSRVVECSAEPPAEMAAIWRNIRRGWYLGDSSFKETLLDCLEGRGRIKRDSNDGDAVRAHDERAAESLLASAWKLLGIDPAKLAGMPKGAPAKVVLAWWLRKQTTVSRQWIAERLNMGHPTRVTASVTAVNQAKKGVLATLRRKLPK